VDATRRGLALLAGEQERRRDPIAFWKCSSWAQELFIRSVVRCISVYGHAGNRAGKTEVGCVLDLGFTQGRPFLLDQLGDPIALPVLKPPVVWALGVKSYKLGGAASIQTLRTLLGEWDYREEHAGAPDNVSLFRIRHLKARNESEWSRLYVFPYDGPDPEGPGLDGWHCDEPPPPSFLETLRFRKRRGRDLRGYITGTPLNKHARNGKPGWAPILEQYPAELAKEVEGRMRLQWSSQDNNALTEADKRVLREEAAKLGKIGLARLNGDHVDDTGGGPWPRVDWDAWLADCVPPIRVERMTVQGERDDASGRKLVPVSFDLQVYEDPQAGDLYYIPGDPAKGMKDGVHNPDGIHVWSRRRRKLCARVNEHLGGWALAEAMSKLHERYNEGLCDPLQTGGYGGVTLSVLRQRGVRNIANTFRETDRGAKAGSLGSTETVAFREGGLDYIEQMLMTRSGTIPSEEVVRCLMSCIVDSAGKIIAGPGDRPGDHGEDLSLTIAACRHIQNRAQHLPEKRPKPQPTSADAFDRSLTEMFGRRVLPDRKVGGKVWDGML